MTTDEKLIAVLESLGSRMERLGDKVDNLARATIAGTTATGKSASVLTAMIHDVLLMKEDLRYVKLHTKPRKLKVAR
jgi:hypothetical protein